MDTKILKAYVKTGAVRMNLINEIVLNLGLMPIVTQEKYIRMVD